MNNLWQSSRLVVRALSEGDLKPTLEVYRACEDFLSLGPVAIASIEMVLDDIPKRCIRTILQEPRNPNSAGNLHELLRSRST
jgi:hypothetical protein